MLFTVETAQKLELPFAPPFLQPHASFIKGVNFASGGSGLLESTSEDRHVSPFLVSGTSKFPLSHLRASIVNLGGDNSANSMCRD